MRLWSESFENGQPIPTEFAFGAYDPEQNVRLVDNRNPHLAWSDLPEGTRSLVLIVHDTEVPGRGDDVNQAGRTVPHDLPRVDFYHWVLVDLPPQPAAIAAGEFSDGITPGGKDAPGPRGTRQGLNNYTQWFEGDAQMAGKYFGYDGPCPPWNDERLHRYHFTLYALDVDKAPVEGEFDGPAVLKAIEGHVLGQASLSGTYHIWPDAR